ncbi:MAG: hypothetical protein A2Y03_04230 [Omnitrophica WOR_2 bacterium GWF2_38_59]|nr:MAG: hypothetical protein A2Y03_04230 [Omnitrophica WOR_2 bacterium GWF2_38_59]OGX52024.1 MAG: hypothetical protein A2267_00565 [Omnitrophica WOR_2 bacterium RIFOXYA12_FULL_38_10]OGX55264.1 MAG: hypothetical protein A2447_01490 [Omnitrophica WOR_2 bacterium RIFOXYC2_FULL_38_12]
MSRKIHHFKFKFIALSLLIFFIAIITSVLLISFDHIKNNTQIKLDNLDLALNFIVEQLKIDSTFVPQDFNDKYLLFILDKKTGEYILDRKFRDSNQRTLWLSYHKKLIYQMQKQSDGLIYYPKDIQNTVFDGTNAIRYFTIDEDGVIVAIETYIESKTAQIKEILQTNTLLKLSGITLIGILFLFFFAQSNFIKMRTTISENLESSFMNMNNENLLYDSGYENNTPHNINSTSPLIFEKLKPIEDEAFQEDIVSRNKPDEIKDEFVDDNKQILEKVDSNKTPLLKTVRKEGRSHKTKEPATSELGNKEAYVDDLTIEIEGIKSPLLKKLIKDIREN